MQRQRGIVGPLILIAIGVMFFLANAGYLPGTFWLVVIRFWPLILILVGIEILLGRTRWGQLLVLLIGLLTLGGVILLAQNPGLIGRGANAQTATIARELSGVRTAELELDSGLGELDLHALGPAGANWVEGTVRYPGSLQLIQTYDVAGDRAHLKLELKGAEFMPGTADEQWQLGLAPGLPIALDVNTGVGNSRIDLTGVRAQTIDLNAGVGNVEVILPATAGSVNAKVDGGIGQLTISIPAGVPARIRARSGIGGLDVDSTRFPSVGDKLYESADFATAADRIEMDVNAGIGSIRIR